MEERILQTVGYVGWEIPCVEAELAARLLGSDSDALAAELDRGAGLQRTDAGRERTTHPHPRRPVIHLRLLSISVMERSLAGGRVPIMPISVARNPLPASDPAPSSA
jgi:hypothetical protein